MNDLYTAVMHDVKNQLAELALRLKKRGDARCEMGIALNASRRISEMLLLSREEDAQLWVNPDTVNPADFLEMLVAEYTELFPAINLTLDTARASLCVFFDEALVRMALGNALHNACRFARSGVRLAAFEQNGMLILEVSDDGPGYPEKVLGSGGKLPLAVSGTGTGLGLYLAYKIADMHRLNDIHGHIELSNCVSGGQFRMILP
jgi:signal transduction histidine kinase